jgi:NADH:ubiquinone oxidoreductase subunit C
MDFDQILARLQQRWPNLRPQVAGAGDPCVVIPAAENGAILRLLRDDPDLACDSLMCLSGADTGSELWVVYHLHSLKHRHRLAVKVVLPRENPALDSATAIWAAAEFLEREVYDLYGVSFRGHPDLRRLLLPPDWEGWPGRKDYVYPRSYRGVTLEREDQFVAADVAKSAAEREAREKKLLSSPAAEQGSGAV